MAPSNARLLTVMLKSISGDSGRDVHGVGHTAKEGDSAIAS